MKFLDITLTGWIVVIVALAMAILTGLMFILGTKRVHYVWGWFCFVITLWAATVYGVTLADTPELGKLWWKISYIAIIFIPFTFFHFVLEFIDNAYFNRYKKYILTLLYATAAVFLVLDLTTDLIIAKAKLLFDTLYYGQPGLVHPYFTVLFVILVLYAHYLVIQEYRKRRTDILFRQRVGFLFIATFIAFAGGTMNFLPFYGIETSPNSNIAVAVGSALAAYAILRYQLFDIRVVTAQFLTLVLVTFAIIRLIISESLQEVVFNTLLLIVTLAVGIYLILSVRKEVQQREQLARLNVELQAANEKLTELNQLKAEFLSFASHQLKAPMAVVKGFASLIYEGNYGKVPPKVKETVGRIKDAIDRLIVLINNFLDLRRLEEGRMEYSFLETDIVKLTKDITDDLEILADKKGLNLSFNAQVNTAMVIADEPKLRQVIQNLVENSIKYTEKGFVKVEVREEREEGKVKSYLIAVSDSGMGIAKDLLPNLFKQFTREAKTARKIQGTGLGLYIAAEMVKAHQGKIWAESAGEGTGSTFYVQLRPASLSGPMASGERSITSGGGAGKEAGSAAVSDGRKSNSKTEL